MDVDIDMGWEEFGMGADVLITCINLGIFINMREVMISLRQVQPEGVVLFVKCN